MLMKKKLIIQKKENKLRAFNSYKEDNSEMDKKSIKLLSFIKVFSIIIILSLNSYSQNKKPIALVFRYDDFPVNINLEKHIISVFNEYNLPIAFGVIPSGTFNLNEYDIQVLKNTDKKKEV